MQNLYFVPFSASLIVPRAQQFVLQIKAYVNTACKKLQWLHLFSKTNQSSGQELHWLKNLDSFNTLNKMKASRKLFFFFLIHNRLYIYRKPLLKCTRLQYFPCQLFKVFPRAFLLPTIQASFSQFSLEFHNS